MRKSCWTLLPILAAGILLALTFHGGAQIPPADAGPAVPIDPGAVAFRILMGRKDAQPTAWDGSLTVTDGKLIRLEGWRFRRQDQIVGESAWKFTTHPAQTGPGGGAGRRGNAGRNGRRNGGGNRRRRPGQAVLTSTG